MAHEWPKDGEHLWSDWAWKRGMPKPIRYRVCVHPECTATEERTESPGMGAG